MNRRESGFALIIVLWSVALLSLLATRLMSTGRTELQLASNIKSSAVIEAQADGVVYATIFRLMSDSAAERAVDGQGHPVALSGGHGLIRVASLAGKINPNTASTPMLSALLQRVGASAGAARSLAAAIADWRTPGREARIGGAKAPQYRAAGLPYTPPGSPFQSVEELRLVLGMTPNLLARLAPHMTVYYPGDTAWTAADPVVASVLQATDSIDIQTPSEGSEKDSVYVEITAQMTDGMGAAFTRRVIAWVGHGSLRGRYRVLRWDPPQ